MNKQSLIIVAVLLLLLSACKAEKEIIYLQDVVANQAQPISNSKLITIMPGDKISIIVSSRNPQMSAIFNLPQVSYRAGQSNITNFNEKLSGYTVDQNGNIDFPQLGKMKVAGLTRAEVAEQVQSSLLSSGLLQDATVVVEFMNLHYSVLGEVKNPGQYPVDNDQITIFDALSKAGDMTIQGKRDSVFVIRESGGQRVTYALDLRSTNGTFGSPAYYIQQNDVVYVKPNNKRARESTVNGNNVLSTSFWISLASLLATVCVLIIK